MIAGETTKPEVQQESHTLALFGMSIQRVEMDFSFEIIRHQIQLATDEIGHATSEKQMNFLYASKTELIMTALWPMLENKPEMEGLKNDHKALEIEMRACYAAYLGVEHKRSGDNEEYTITMAGPRYGDEKKVRGEEGSPLGTVVCGQTEYERSLILAEENLYRKMNCTARDHFRRALAMAFKVGMLSVENKVSIQRDKGYKDFSRPGVVPNGR